MRRFIWCIPVLIVVDQLSKWWVVSRMALGDSRPLLQDIFHLTYVQNTGAAFGILRGQRWLFVVLAVVVVVWVLYSCWHESSSKLALWGGILIAAGALGNLIDRIFLGYVVDFLDFRIWPVFNVADSCISIGVVLLLWLTLKPSKTSS